MVVAPLTAVGTKDIFLATGRILFRRKNDLSRYINVIPLTFRSSLNMASNVQRNTEARILYKKRRTVLKTLRDRGYALPPGEEKLSFQDFLELYRSEQHHIYFEGTPPGMPEDESRGGGIYVYFEKNDEFTKKMLETQVAGISQEYPDLDKLFFVLKTGTSKKRPKVNVFVQSAIEKNKEYAHVEILEKIYAFDVTKNVLVPEHRLLTEDEVEAKRNEYGDLTKLPRYLPNDAIVKHYGAKQGNIFLIKRLGGLGVYYRMVGLGDVEPLGV
jgi:DNA-directed RNA polymerase subunit H (RpoH/RPB5)